MYALAHAIIRVLEAVFIVGAVICLLAVIPVTAYRLFLVLFERDEEGHKPEANPGSRRPQPI